MILNCTVVIGNIYTEKSTIYYKYNNSPLSNNIIKKNWIGFKKKINYILLNIKQLLDKGQGWQLSGVWISGREGGSIPSSLNKLITQLP